MRGVVAVLVGSMGLIACNALVGWGDLHEVNDPAAAGDDDDGGASGKKNDGGTSGGEAGAFDAGPRCDPTKDFGAPVKLNIDTTPGVEGYPTLSADELTLYFEQGPTIGSPTISSSTRLSRDDPNWSPPTPVTSLNDGQNGGFPTVDPNNVVLYLAEAVEGPRTQIYRAARQTTGLQFSAATPFAPTSSGATDDSPFITADGKELYFSSDREDPPGHHLWRSVRSVGGSYQAPEEVNDLKGGPPANHPEEESEERQIALTFDGLTAYFSSNRDGGLGQYDIWTAHRATEADSFGQASLVANVNSDGEDNPSWVSQDNCVLYFTRVALGGDPDIWVATRGQ